MNQDDDRELAINKEYDYSNIVPELGDVSYLINCCDQYYKNFIKLCDEDEEKNKKLKNDYKNYRYKKIYETDFEISIKQNNDFFATLTCKNYDSFYYTIIEQGLKSIDSLVITLNLSYRRGKEFKSDTHNNLFIISFKPYDIKFKRKSNYTDSLMDNIERAINDILSKFITQDTIFCMK